MPDEANALAGLVDVSEVNDQAGDAVANPLFYETGADGLWGKVRLISADEASGLAMALRTMVDQTRGIFAARAQDCDFANAAGVSFAAAAADQETQAFYFASGVPVTTLAQTDAEGTGGFLNLPPGLGVITATSVVAGNKVLGSLSFNIRPGTLTLTEFQPVP